MSSTPGGADTKSLATRLGYVPGNVVQELGWDDDVDDDLRIQIEDAIDGNSVLSLKAMEAQPGDPSTVNLYYGQSWHIVKYLIDTYGQGKYAALFAEFKRGSTVGDALTTVYGFDVDGLENEWRAANGLPARSAATATPTPSSSATPAATLTPFSANPGTPVAQYGDGCPTPSDAGPAIKPRPSRTWATDGAGFPTRRIPAERRVSDTSHHGHSQIDDAAHSRHCPGR